MKSHSTKREFYLTQNLIRNVLLCSFIKIFFFQSMFLLLMRQNHQRIYLVLIAIERMV